MHSPLTDLTARVDGPVERLCDRGGEYPDRVGRNAVHRTEARRFQLWAACTEVVGERLAARRRHSVASMAR